MSRLGWCGVVCLCGLVLCVVFCVLISVGVCGVGVVWWWFVCVVFSALIGLWLLVW